ncbi:MAG: uracil-DNA glycosylase [Bacillota bacterium]|nr:uracil-DNA glycosylase [Bacillota bacterium]
MENVRADCSKCLYYYITWDAKFPYGCKLFGFKSRHSPGITVRQSTGKVCENFTEKR